MLIRSVLPLRRLKILQLLGGSILLASLTQQAHAAGKATVSSGDQRIVAPLVPGDEPIVVTEHRIQTQTGPLDYEAKVGRLPIRDQVTGEIRGRIFFVSYSVKTKGPPRPVTFAWNGGPVVASSIIHMGLGPRRPAGDHALDNPDTLLKTSDLVFMDAVETGFSRPETPDAWKDFNNLKGDVAATVEFIRAFRDRFAANDQPLFICGESYGVFRAAAVTDELAKRKVDVAGTILISGDIPNIPQPVPFYDAMHVPARTATAFYYKRLDPDLMKDREATMKAATDWAINIYEPALGRLDKLTPSEKDKLAADLARYTGMKPENVDRKTMVIHVNLFLNNFLSSDGSKTLSGEDTRQLAEDEKLPFGSPKLIDSYLRGELGYRTDLTYNDVDTGYTRTPGPPGARPGEGFYYNLEALTPEDKALFDKYEEVTWIARSMPQFMPDALKREKDLKMFVATGRYDPLNMCEGDVRVTAQLPADQANRVTNHCYESGHVVYDDPKAKPGFLADVAHFVSATVASMPAKKADDANQPAA